MNDFYTSRIQELHRALPLLLERGLNYSAQWAAQLLQSLENDKKTNIIKQININENNENNNDNKIKDDNNEDEDNTNSFDERNENSSLKVPMLSSSSSTSSSSSSSSSCINTQTTSCSVYLAQSYFRMRQYAQAADVAKQCQSSLAIFIAHYALHLANQMHKVDRSCECVSSVDEPRSFTPCDCVIAQLRDQKQQLANLYSQHNIDAHLLYIYGVVLSELGELVESRSVLVQSVNRFPYNWSAWKLLASLCEDKNMIANLNLHNHWMRSFFLADVYLEVHENKDALNVLKSLSAPSQFTSSTHVLAQSALAYYNEREFDIAQDLFEELRDSDPHRLESMDTYSNILYVKEARSALSYLAHTAVKIDKYRPETCCIIGNYYSLRSDHEKAVLYFTRALRLNPRYLSAWTLMGHEYVELRNTPKAIESYRRAVDINPRDFRAWYGLGQTYEILQMHTYSLFYFRKATQLRPYDPRMWCAMAESYERLERTNDAIKCYKRAENNNDREGIAFAKLAKLYEVHGDTNQAAQYYMKVLERRSDEAESADSVDALLFLAQFYKERQQWNDAELCCTRLLDIGGAAKDIAKSMQKEIYQLRSRHSSMLQQQ